MKLAALYCVWDDFDLLRESIKNMEPLVDGIIIIASENSNLGEKSQIPNDIKEIMFRPNFEPDLNIRNAENETNKRNYALLMAKQAGYTHFIMMDADEFYEPEPFLKEKQRFLNENLNGLVCASQVYFKSPKLTIGLDTTRVTFIHKITSTLKFEFNRSFPFAFDKLDIRIDPTRQLNINNGVEWSNIICHHFSWVRKDFEKKIRNSTARANIERSTIRQDLALAEIGYFCKFYNKTLFRATVDFNIPYVHEDIQPVETDHNKEH